MAIHHRYSASLLVIAIMSLVGCQSPQSLRDAGGPELSDDGVGDEHLPPADTQTRPEPEERNLELRIALQRCEDIQDIRRRTDCLAQLAATFEELTSSTRQGLCNESPFPLRCHYLLARAEGEPHPCLGRLDGLWPGFDDECWLLQAIEAGDIERCPEIVEGEPRSSDDSQLLRVCTRIAAAERLMEAPFVSHELPTDGDGLHELLAPYYLAMAYEYHLHLLERELLYDVRYLAWNGEDYELWQSDCIDAPLNLSRAWTRLQAMGFPQESPIQFAQLFHRTYGRNVWFHEDLGRFDAETWDGLEEMFTALRFYGLSWVSHVPQDTLTFNEDGSYVLRERVTGVDDHSLQRFELHQGRWEIVSATPGESWAVIMLDGEPFAFGFHEGGFILHPSGDFSGDTPKNRAAYTQFEYTGEC